MDELKSRFNELKSQWEEETGMLSFVSQKVRHHSYQEIIKMGTPVIPVLLKELEKSPNNWFFALRAISGVDPVRPEYRGNIRLMAASWISRGKLSGII